MKRRAFIAALGGTAAAWPLAVRAQQVDPRRGMQRIGVLMGYAENDSEPKRWLSSFVRGLSDSGQVVGTTIEIKYRWATGNVGQIRSAAGELMAWRPDVILSASSPALVAMRQETRTVPIVFVNVADPVDQGFVASFSAPGGNVTGFTSMETTMGGKWVELLKEIYPATREVMVLVHPDTAPFYPLFQRAIETAASALRIRPQLVTVRDPDEVKREINSLDPKIGLGLITMPSAFMAVHRDLVISLVAQRRVPTMYAWNYYVRSGGLISYGPNASDMFRRASSYVDQILKGAKPATMPVQQPNTFELVINIKTARALGITVPPTLLARADEVIE